MKKSMALALGICVLSSSLYGCSSEPTSVQKVYASEDIAKYNDSILEACNFEVNNGEISESSKIAKTNIDALRNALESNTVNYKVKLEDLDYYLADVRFKIIETYKENKYILESTDLDSDEVELNEELIEEQNIYFDLAKAVRDDINRIDRVKNKDFIKYLDLVYDICNRYNDLPDNYKNIIPNKNVLVNEVEMLGGKIDKNFNIEKQKYLYEVRKLTQIESDIELDDEVDKTYDGEIEPYTGVSDEELGLAETYGSDSPYGRKRGENYLDESTSSSEVDTQESIESTEESTSQEYSESEFQEETVQESVEQTEESTEEISITEENNETIPYSYTEFEESQTNEIQIGALNINAKSLVELSEETNIAVDVYKLIKDGGDQFTVDLDIEDLRDYVARIDSRLSYENSSWYINLEGAPESGEIDLVGGYYISWIIQKNEPTEFKLTDYIYWDTNGFKVRCINENGRMVTLEGYVSDDIIYINNITDILDSINPARAYIYNRNDETSDEDYYEEESIEETSTIEETESIEETLNESIEE